MLCGRYQGIQEWTGFRPGDQLFAKGKSGEVCGGVEQFHKGAGKQAARNVPGSLFYKLCMISAQFHGGMQDAPSRAVRQLPIAGWRKPSEKLSEAGRRIIVYTIEPVTGK